MGDLQVYNRNEDLLIFSDPGRPKMKLVTVKEMKMMESGGNQKGISYEEMMLRAGKGLAEVVEKRYANKKSLLVVGLVGGGNNGGDTLIALTSLEKNGWKTCALLVKERTDDPLVKSYSEAGGKSIMYAERGFANTAQAVLGAADLILDGVLGTGTTLPLRDDARKFLKLIGDGVKNQSIVAVDCPSGVDCESGAAAQETLKAELTVCMEAVKAGLIQFPAFEYCGEIMTITIGLDKFAHEKSSQQDVVDADWVKNILPKRPKSSHKGTFGNVMVVGGSVNYVGAPVLSGLAAYRTGCGLVTLAVPQTIHPILAGRFLETVWLILDDQGGVISESAADLVAAQLTKVDALVVGPGIGQEETTARFLETLFFQKSSNGKSRRVGFLLEEPNGDAKEHKLPTIVLDADGLRWIAQNKDWNEKVKSKLVLTPHPGEMAALTGLTMEEIQSNRIAVVIKYALEWKQVVVLKGALTVIAAPDGRMNLIPVASSALAKAGSGDVLSGMIASLIGQGVTGFEAASAAAWLHAQAGLRAARELGCEASVLASDIIEAIPGVIAELNKNTA
jgi:NAD(P)H-hydrate epimerase